MRTSFKNCVDPHFGACFFSCSCNLVLPGGGFLRRPRVVSKLLARESGSGVEGPMKDTYKERFCRNVYSVMEGSQLQSKGGAFGYWFWEIF